MLIEKLTMKLDEPQFVESFINDPDATVQKEFGITLDEMMKSISGTGEKYENFMNKLAAVMDCEFLTAAASSCCS